MIDDVDKTSSAQVLNDLEDIVERKPERVVVEAVVTPVEAPREEPVADVRVVAVEPVAATLEAEKPSGKVIRNKVVLNEPESVRDRPQRPRLVDDYVNPNDGDLTHFLAGRRYTEAARIDFGRKRILEDHLRTCFMKHAPMHVRRCQHLVYMLARVNERSTGYIGVAKPPNTFISPEEAQ